MMKKRSSVGLGCLLLAFLMLFCSCRNDAPTPETPTEQAGSDNVMDELVPAVDMGGREMVLLSDPALNQSMMFVLDEYDGDPINAVAVERTKYIEDRYGVRLKVVERAGTSQTLRQSHMAGGGEFDLVYPHPTDGFAALLTSGALADLNTFNALHFDREWWNQSQVTNYNANGHLYLAVSDFSILGQGLLCLLYNINQYTALGFKDDLYGLVNSGDWTMEKLCELVTESASSVEGTEGRNGYGLVYWKEVSYTFMYAMGQNILNKNADGAFELALQNSMLTSISEAVCKLLYETNDNVLLDSSNNAGFATSLMWTTYSNGNSLFMTYDVGALSSYLRDLSFDVGYLPLPKLDKTQKEYRSICASGFMGIPVLAKDPGQSSIILEALSIYSFQKLKPAFFDTILMGRLSENAADYAMLEFLHSSKFYDFGYSFDDDGMGRNLLYNVAVTIKTPKAVTTYMKGNKAAFEKIVATANGIQ